LRGSSSFLHGIGQVIGHTMHCRRLLSKSILHPRAVSPLIRLGRGRGCQLIVQQDPDTVRLIGFVKICWFLTYICQSFLFSLLGGGTVVSAMLPTSFNSFLVFGLLTSFSSFLLKLVYLFIKKHIGSSYGSIITTAILVFIARG
jgi:hypothetical protein